MYFSIYLILPFFNDFHFSKFSNFLVRGNEKINLHTIHIFIYKYIQFNVIEKSFVNLSELNQFSIAKT